jgi:DNA-binding IscR family transcriptional regulator
VVGRSGGFDLKRSADGITLADIYSAVEDQTVFRMHKLDEGSECPVAAQLGKVLAPSLKAAENAMAVALGKTTLRDVAAGIMA